MQTKTYGEYRYAATIFKFMTLMSGAKLTSKAGRYLSAVVTLFGYGFPCTTSIVKLYSDVSTRAYMPFEHDVTKYGIASTGE